MILGLFLVVLLVVLVGRRKRRASVAAPAPVRLLPPVVRRGPSRRFLVGSRGAM